MLNYAWVDDRLTLHLGGVCLKHSLTACTFGRTTRDNGLEYKQSMAGTLLRRRVLLAARRAAPQTRFAPRAGRRRCGPYLPRGGNACSRFQPLPALSWLGAAGCWVPFLLWRERLGTEMSRGGERAGGNASPAWVWSVYGAVWEGRGRRCDRFPSL